MAIVAYNKGAYKIMEALYADLTGGIGIHIENNADYVYAMEDLREKYGSEYQFYDAVYRDIIMKLEPIAWNVPDVEDPFHFLRTDYGRLDAMKREGYVFSRPLDRDENCQDFYERDKVGDPDYNWGTEVAETYRWSGKDYPTKTIGAFGMDTFYDCLSYYRSKLEGAMYDPYEFYSMFSAIKRAWMNNWKQKVAMYEMNVFNTYVSSLYNARESKYVNGETVYEDANTRRIKLLSEFNALYRTGAGAKPLTIDNWFLPENIREFAPWAYIRINEVIKQMRFKNTLFMGDNFTQFRNKYYAYEYGATDLATIFLRKPFLLMKSYANAEVFNENDLETVDVNYVDYLTDNTNPTKFYTKGRYYTNKTVRLNDEGDNQYEWSQSTDYESQTINTFVGVIYDKKAMAVATYDTHIRDTGLNERTEHGVLHLHGKLANYINLMVKGVVIVLE